MEATTKGFLGGVADSQTGGLDNGSEQCSSVGAIPSKSVFRTTLDFLGWAVINRNDTCRLCVVGTVTAFSILEWVIIDTSIVSSLWRFLREHVG